MRIDISFRDLAKALDKMRAFVPQSTSNALLITTVSDVEVEISLTGDVSWAKCRLEANVKIPGQGATDALILHSFAKASMSQNGQIAIKENLFRLKDESSVLKIGTIGMRDLWNPVFLENPAYQLCLSTKEFTKALNLVHFAALEGKYGSSESISLCGINIVCKDGEFYIQATDRQILGKKFLEIDSKSLEIDVSLPSAFMRSFLSGFDGIKGDTNISFDYGGVFQLDADEYKFGCRVFDGLYPPTKRATTLENTASLNVNRASLINAIQLTKLDEDRDVAENKSKSLFSFSTTEVIVKKPVNSIQVQTSVPVISSVIPEGFEFPIAFNRNKVLSILTRLDSDEVALKFSGPLRPMFIVDESQLDYIAMVMPQTK